MLQSLRELGLLSARYAEEEALRAKQRLVFSADGAQTARTAASTESSAVSTPVPSTAPTPKIVKLASAPASRTSSLPGSPVIVQSPPNPSEVDTSSHTSSSTPSVPAASIIPILPAQRASFPGLNFVPVTSPAFTAFPAQQGLIMTTPMGFTTMTTLAPTLPATMVAAPQQYQPPVQYTSAPSVEVFSSLSNSRVRKPFHKRRPAHMDKNMLFCHFCGRKDTPEWRKGPSGPATLCNACGLQWAKKMRAQRSSTSTKTAEKAPSKSPEVKPSESDNVKVEA